VKLLVNYVARDQPTAAFPNGGPPKRLYAAYWADKLDQEPNRRWQTVWMKLLAWLWLHRGGAKCTQCMVHAARMPHAAVLYHSMRVPCCSSWGR
jgi:hypothetical protein